MTTIAVLSVFAHQGGWDEVLFVLAPLAVFALLLVMARRRVDRMEEAGRDEHPDDGEGSGPT